MSQKKASIFEFMKSADTGSQTFVKVNDGETVQLRILSKPVTGWEVFADGKPHRWCEGQEKPDNVPDTDETPRPFVAFVVFQYTEPAAVKVWQFSQKTVMKSMEMLFQGGQLHWSTFIINLNRKGTKMDTQWTLNGTQVPIEDNLISFATQADKYVDLNALFLGDSPIIQPLPSISVDVKTPEAGDLPF
jgi:hypothetical protein